MHKYNYIKIHIDLICVGDVIFHDGADRTVCAKDIKHDPFMGRSIFGDCYHCGHKSVMKKVLTRQ